MQASQLDIHTQTNDGNCNGELIVHAMGAKFINQSKIGVSEIQKQRDIFPSFPTTCPS